MARKLTSGMQTYTAREAQSIGLLDFVIDTLVLCSLKSFLNLGVGILVGPFLTRFENILCIPDVMLRNGNFNELGKYPKPLPTNGL